MITSDKLKKGRYWWQRKSTVHHRWGKCHCETKVNGKSGLHVFFYSRIRVWDRRPKNWLRSLSDIKDNHWLKLQSSQLTWFCLRVVVKTQQRTRIFQSILRSPRRRRRANKQHGHLSNDLRRSVTAPQTVGVQSCCIPRR